LLIAFLSFADVAAGQVNPGYPSFSAEDCGSIDCINLQNLAVSLNIPVMSKNGTFPFSYKLSGNFYDSVVTGGVEATFNPSDLPGSPSVLNGSFAGILGDPSIYGAASGNVSSVTCPTAYGTGKADEFAEWSITLADGTMHRLPTTDVSYHGATCSSGFTDQVIDETGYTLSVTGGTVNSIYNSSGVSITKSSVTDSNGNSVSYNATTSQFKDSMGLNVLTLGGTAEAGSFTWTSAGGSSPNISVTTTSKQLRTYFNCTGTYEINDWTATSASLPTTIGFPDSTAIGLSYEATPAPYGADSTGRLSEITLRSGSTIEYNWNPGSLANDGMNCQYGLPVEVTRQTSDGTVSYTLTFTLLSDSSSEEQDTKIDMGGNKTIYTFTGLSGTYAMPRPPVTQALTEVQYYPNIGTVSSPTYSSTAAKTIVYCYNSSSPTVANCPTATVNEPITEIDAFTQLSRMTNYSRQQTQFDGGPSGTLPHLGNVTYTAQYDFGGTTPIRATTTVYGTSNGSGTCSSIGSNINNKPCTVVTTLNGNTVASSQFSYDSKGNLLKKYVSPNGGTSFLSNPTANVYNSNGTPSTLYDLAGNSTTFTYNSAYYTDCSSCTQFPFATSSTKGGLTTYSYWNGYGGTKTEDVDANRNAMFYGYVNSSSVADPWSRLNSATDPLGNETWISPAVTSNDTTLTFNSGQSVQNTIVTTDGFGRPILTQKQQGPGSSYYDTVEQSYCFTCQTSAQTYVSVPCTGTVGSTACVSVGRYKYYDVLGRLVGTDDGGGGYVNNTYSQNDVLTVLGPAPAGENLKQVQKQYDGLGRLTSSCALSSTATGNVACGQNVTTSPTNGILTTTAYTSASGSQTVSSTRGVQTRSKTVDGLGRVIVSTTPEGGTWHYYYDSSYSSCPSGYTGAPGQLEASVDPDGNVLCYQYDSQSRVKAINANGTVCRGFWYDSATEFPTGVTVANGAGRMIEAYTWNCATTLLTDEWFSYEKDGNKTDIWELTPNSTQYYHSTATFNGNNSVASVRLASPSLYAATYGIDGEGRWNTLSNGQSVVNATTYNAATQPTSIGLGAGTDGDTYTYDPNTGRMVNWTFTVNSQSEFGAPICGDGYCTLNWNANGTLKEFGITDGFNSGGSQVCYFNPSAITGTGYDDLGRLIGSSCGPIGDANGSLWNQSDSYDQYDNLTKSSTGFVSWNPGYSSSTNHYTCTGCTYDAGGNVTHDETNAYKWDPFGKMLSVNASGTNCSTGGQCLVYDAFGRIVEIDSYSSSSEIWYTQLGKTAYMNGTTYNYAYWPTPGGGTLLNTSASVNYYMHKDWLGSGRIVSTVPYSGNGTVTTDQAFAPYSEVYDIFGSTEQNQIDFTGLTQDVFSGMYDTPNRELQGSLQGRWLSPDPAGSGWNQYAYPTNPNSNTDPTGLFDETDRPYKGQQIDPQAFFNGITYLDFTTAYVDGGDPTNTGGGIGGWPDSGSVDADSGSGGTLNMNFSAGAAMLAGLAAASNDFDLAPLGNGSIDFSNAQQLSLSYDSFDYLAATDPILRYGLMTFGMLAGSGEEGIDEEPLTGQGSGVNNFDISQDVFEHIIEGHTSGGSDTAYNSIFVGDAQGVANLIQNSQSSWAVVQGNGNFAYVNFTNENVGFLANGQGANVYTVIVNPAGGVVTAYPGFPGQP
jgi:RHS repeat-associated protein